MTFEVGMAVEVLFRGRKVPGVLVAAEPLRRGRRAGMVRYAVAPDDPALKKKYLSIGVVTDDPARFLTARATLASTRVRVDDYRARVQARRDAKERRTEQQRAALGEVDWRSGQFGGPLATANVAPGDRVLVRGRPVDWWGTVGAVNPCTGKVGLVKPGYDEAVRRHAGVLALAAEVGAAGLLVGRRGPREFRWLPATAIVKVESPESPLPFTWTQEDAAALDAAPKGFVQRRFGAEFIERSYVVARERAKARLGNDYECASRTVYRDPGTGLFWRATGSFD